MKRDLVKTNKTPADSAALSELDQMIGERRAFSRIGDSCSAADAECLKRIRTRKLYLLKNVSWDGFCWNYLDISRAEADKIIRRFDEFGDSYFNLSRIVRISPESYRAIAPAIKGKTIEYEGEQVPLVPDNARRVNAIVQSLRVAALPKRQPKPAPVVPKPPSTDPVYERLNEIELQARAIVKELREICQQSGNSRDRQRIQTFAHDMKYTMHELEVQAA